MAIKITSTKSHESSSINVLVYGASGAGKTVLCSTTPSPIIISAEAGLLSLAEVDFPVIEVKTIKDVEEAYSFIAQSKEGKKYRTVCLDSITEIAEVCLSQHKEKEIDPRNAYGKLADDLGKLIRKFRDIESRHVYFTAKQLMGKNDLGVTSYVPNMPGKQLLMGLPYFFDEVFALRLGKLDNGTLYRYLQTTSDMQYIGKDRSGKLEKIEEPNLTKIFNKINSKNKDK